MAYQFQLWEKAMTTEWIKAIVKWQKENPGKDWLEELKKGRKKNAPPLPPKPPKI